MIREIVFSGFWIAIWLGAMASPAQAGQKPTPADQVRFFESSIRPLFVEQCQKCHGAKKQEGNLNLDSRESILKGGDRGPAVVVGQPEKSLLIHAVRHTNKSLRMPDGGKKLSDRQIADLTRWVQMEAPFPQQENAARTDDVKKKDWWPFKAADPAVPKVRDTAWPQTPLDHFILAWLEAKGLKPAARADRRTLIPRATYDLLGLPPTPEEIDAFVNDKSPDAFFKLVERLLASPHYGPPLA